MTGVANKREKVRMFGIVYMFSWVRFCEMRVRSCFRRSLVCCKIGFGGCLEGHVSYHIFARTRTEVSPQQVRLRAHVER